MDHMFYDVLVRIAVALEQQVQLMTPPVPEAEPQPIGCQHPEEARVDFGLTNGMPDWECRRCGYRPDVATATETAVALVGHGR